MLVLTTLARGSKAHGFEIAEAIEQASTEVLRVEEGSLPPTGAGQDRCRTSRPGLANGYAALKGHDTKEKIDERNRLQGGAQG